MDTTPTFRHLDSPDDWTRAFDIMKELRPHLTDADAFCAQLLNKVREIARRASCAHFLLDTGLHMALAQRFYFRNGLLARGMHFVESLAQSGSECAR
ncbi:hypothetical protein FAZ95_27235 [Trinickia violacea]|uniref:GNAT family N-acetyltransferase n=1 Tax=Trinickia violacea TaxID=2571746 RepID=A0A4P8IWE8_9BURK|nr:hypothetical protein [Trinickia violacea]QCP52821.1 hypothetical protein FAZ95_27235 [Trinickia violacea]